MSFSIGLSGLKAAQEELNVTGNNIANAGTIGFKKSRTEFGDVFAASILGGGANQQGSGVALQNISQDFSQGNVTYTGNSLDLAINGTGFFVLKGDSGSVFTRAGAFGTDKQGYIVNTQGERLQGYAADSDGNASGSGALIDLIVQVGDTAPNATSNVQSSINLDAGTSASSIIGTTLVTNQGTSGNPVLGVQLARQAQITGQISVAGTDFSGTTSASLIGDFNVSGGLDFTAAGGNQGFSISVNGGAYQAIDLSTGTPTNPANMTDLISYVQAKLDAALLAPNNVVVTELNNRLVLTSAASGDSSNITIGLVEGLAQNIVTAGSEDSGLTAPATGFTLSLGVESVDIIINSNFSNSGSAAQGLGGGAGSGNEALEDEIQKQINASPALTGRITVAINSDGTLSFTAVEAGDQELLIDPVVSTPGFVNFDETVSFYTDRREGVLEQSSLDFSAGTTQFKVSVGGNDLTITLNKDYSPGGVAGQDLGDEPESGLEALEDYIQSEINNSTLPGNVIVSIGANGEIVFELTDSTENSLDVSSVSTTAQTAGAIDVSNGFNFDGSNGGVPYTFTAAYSVNGGATVTSNPIVLTGNYSSGEDLVEAVQDAIDTDTNFSFGPSSQEVIVRIDSTTGFLVLETTDAGPLSQLSILVTTPAIVPTPSVFGDTSGSPGALVNGSGPAVDFNTIATFVGSEVNNIGANALSNGYGAEVVSVVDANNNIQNVTVPAGTSANEVVQLFASVSGVAAKATTVAYITDTNRGDQENRGVGLNPQAETNLDLRFAINGLNLESSKVNSAARLGDIATQINSSVGNLVAEIIVDGLGVSVLKITEINGLDLNFSGGSSGQGSISIQSSTRDPLTGDAKISPLDASVQQIANLGNLNQDAIVVGGIVDFTLDEGVVFTDAATTSDGTVIQATQKSIFGNIGDPGLLSGVEFELNIFDPKDSSTYYKSTAVPIYDSVGNQHTLTQYFVKERDDNGVQVQGAVWSVYMQIDGEKVGYDPNNPNEPSEAQYTVIFDQNGQYDPGNQKLYVTNWTPRDSEGNISSGAAGPLKGDISQIGELSNSNFEVDLSELTQYGGDFAVDSNVQDGYAKGQLVGVEVNEKGVIFARFSNGQSQVLGEVALANFENASGLANIGGTRFAETADSGPGTASSASTAGLGVIQSGALEESNVDLSDQLVQMIISQRNFQAAAQIIEAADTTTQTIINL